MGRCGPSLPIIFYSKLNEVCGNLDRAHPLFYESISGLFIPELSEEPRLSGGAVNHFRKSRKPLLADVHIQPSSLYMLEMTVVCKVSSRLLNPPRTGRPSYVLGDGQLPTKLVSYGLHSKSGKHFSRLTVQLLLQSGATLPLPTV